MLRSLRSPSNKAISRFLLLATFAIFPFAAFAQLPTVRLRIEQDPQMLGVEPAIEEALRGAGLKLGNSPTVDATLDIELSGKALSQSYSMFGIGSGTTYYTGASLVGTLLLERPGHGASTAEFIGHVSPPDRLPGGSGSTTISGAPFLKAFQSSDFLEGVAQALRKSFGDEVAISFLINVVGRKSGNALKAKETLAAIGTKAIGPIMASLPKVSLSRDDAASILRFMRLDDSVAAMQPYLSNLSPSVRQCAIETLGEYGHRGSAELIAKALISDQDAAVRSAAARVLNATTAFDQLVSALGDREIRVRADAAESLGKIKDYRSMEPLERLFRTDTNPLVRLAALTSLTRLGGSPISLLISALGDSDAEVRLAATREIGSLKDQSAVGPLISAMRGQPISTRRHLAEALKKITGQDFGLDPLAWAKWLEALPK